MIRFASILFGIVLAPAAVKAFSPGLDLIVPRGGQRGTEVAVEFRGDRLEGIQEALFYDPGITLKDIEVKDTKKVVAKFAIAADAPLGEHSLRLRSPGGLTELRTFWVGQFPTVAEVEPNNSFDQAQRVDLNVTVAGVAGNEDEDYYVCSLKKGQRLSVEVEAMRLGRTMFDPYVAVLDPHKFELAVCDDAPLLRNDAFVSVIAPEDGDYRVLVREAAYEGNDQCDYRLHIGTFPRPSAVFPPGGKPGEAIDFRFVGDPGGPITQKVTLPNEPGRFPLYVTSDGLTPPSPNRVMVSPLEHVEETEPNNSAGQATVMPAIPCAGQGILAEKGDTDWYKFHATKGENLTLHVHGRDLRSPIDSVLRLRDPKNEKQIGENDDQGGPDSIIQWSCPADGDYYAIVSDKLGRSGPDFIYRLEIVRREPAIAAALPVVERANSQKWKTFAVPRGNRYAAVVNVTRENTGCEIGFEAASLPAGVTMTSVGVPKSTNNFPVVFEAAADAPVAGGLYPFTIHSTGDGPALKGPLKDVIDLVDINNQGAYHSVPLDRVAMAVTEESPVKIELEASAVPLVRNGVLSLKVRAIRAEGYKDAITLHFLWSPPGVTAPTTVQIPEGQSEALYELNANGDAPVAEWNVCVLAEAPTPKGTVLVSSTLVPLKVAEPYLSATLELAATEQGKAIPLSCKIEVQHPFEGDAVAELMGLPSGVSTPTVAFKKDQTSIVFPLAVAADATVGKHGNLFCRIKVPENGATILHQVGQSGTLRVDKPSQPVIAQASTEKKPDAPAPAPAAAAKPLSRLEQLRQHTP